ncbi:unnamed protein product [Ilex paraguariensis]|uniref:Aquaporin NIP-type n=1 Tax=Ilex paraguariensis TaxID=185542 RepID=A0ABC8SI61_9AQUA
MTKDIVVIEEGPNSVSYKTANEDSSLCTSTEVVVLTQKVIAEVIGTYFLILIGCGSVVVNKIYDSVTFPGICVAWGLAVMVLVYSVGHISGAHFNPAVTITFTIFRHFPLKQASSLVPLYIVAQLVGSLLASATLCLLFDTKTEDFFGTVPVGSNIQSLAIEFLTSFLLMFVISGVATDSRSPMIVCYVVALRGIFHIRILEALHSSGCPLTTSPGHPPATHLPSDDDPPRHPLATLRFVLRRRSDLPSNNILIGPPVILQRHSNLPLAISR